MRFLAILACGFVFSVAARADTGALHPEPLHPSRVSFADMVRLSADAAPPPEPAPGPRRIAYTEAADEPLFTVRPVREPAWWLLLLSGLAAAGWVAHRRLVNRL